MASLQVCSLLFGGSCVIILYCQTACFDQWLLAIMATWNFCVEEAVFLSIRCWEQICTALWSCWKCLGGHQA